MKKFFLLLVTMGIIFCSCLNFAGKQPSGEISEMDYNKIIIGQWIYEFRGKIQMYDFKPGTDVQVRSINERGKETYNQIWKYQIKENSIAIGKIKFGIKFNSLDELQFIMKFGKIESTIIAKRFDTQPGENVTEELVTLEQAESVESALKTTSNAIMTSLLKNAGDIEKALVLATGTILPSLREGINIAILNIATEDDNQSMFIENELEFILVNMGFTVVDRRQVDVIIREQNFQLSGYVNDNEIVSVGKFSGADIIITGAINGSGMTRRLRLRLLDTETARVIAAASERI